MAKCDLSIELDDPDRVYSGGERITGTVRVHADADVNCQALEVRSVWKTHGRGNVATATIESSVVFSGTWKSGETSEHRFDLVVGHWPPTYHGHYLNIDHYIEAQAKVPWAFDSHASTMFLMNSLSGPTGDTKGHSPQQTNKLISAVVGAAFFLFIGFFCVASVVNPFMMAIIAILGSVVAAFWFIRVFLPKYLLGHVESELSTETLSPGDSVKGSLKIRPRKNVSINGIELTIEAKEQCVSGSGSNKTTHRHVIFDQKIPLAAATTLRSEQLHEFPYDVPIPTDAPYSVDLSDNDLIWNASLRVDIPRWPDWTETLAFQVIPSADGRSTYHLGPPTIQDESASQTANSNMDEATVTFDETAKHLWSVRDNNDAAAMLAEAVTGLSFSIEAQIDRRLLYGGDDQPKVYPNGYAVWAFYVDPPLPMVLFIPHELGDEFEQIGQGIWRGIGTVIGWDSAHRRLQVRVDQSSVG